MPAPLLIKNGRIIDPANSFDDVRDLLIVDGRIADPATNIPSDVQEVDASGCWVIPGLIDMHVHLREPGEEYKEDILSGTKAAAAGGFTAVACMPNTKPVNDSRAVTSLILSQATHADARVYPVAAISKNSQGSALTEFGELRATGAVAVSDDGLPVRDSQLMRRALEYADDHDLLVISHSEEPSLSNGVMNEGIVSTRLGLKGIPNAAESIMVYRDIALAECLGKRIHIAHVSTAMSTDLIRSAKARGVRVTAETAPHYFTLTDEAVVGYNTNAKMNPPLRTEQDRQAIRQGLADGTFDAIATDHAPHSILEKEVEFDRAMNGIIGLETSLPLSLALVREGVLDENKLVELLSVNPARILGVEGGTLSAGARADVTIVNPDLQYTYTEEQVVSKSKNSPFLDVGATGRSSLQGRAVYTIMGGRITHRLA
ncbi:dihydroorotase [Candidatus Electrothrix sp.]|uniref:dihydroorotase n=1 Tax=Candidatus Electrothrix sp. TaxID=2170559 RepID=UPI004056A192